MFFSLWRRLWSSSSNPSRGAGRHGARHVSCRPQLDSLEDRLLPALGAGGVLGLSAAALLRLPRPGGDERVFRTPAYPLPLVLFLLLIGVVLVLFAAGRPRETFIGAAIALAGVPVSFFVIRRP